MRKTPVFVISDRTGITGETLCHSLLTQFPQIKFDTKTVPFIDTTEKVEEVVFEINQAAKDSGSTPLVFTTLVLEEHNQLLKEADCKLFDFFGTFIGPMEQALGVQSSHSMGRTHGMVDIKKYSARISAVNYAVHCDDGLNPQDYDRADIILLGVSRSGKTPTSLYLALHYGLACANFPLTDDELLDLHFPESLENNKDKLFGLLIDPVRLQHIRQERRADSRYASLEQCRFEIEQAKKLYSRENIPYVDSTALSVEELAATIMHAKNLKRAV